METEWSQIHFSKCTGHIKAMLGDASKNCIGGITDRLARLDDEQLAAILDPVYFASQ